MLKAVTTLIAAAGVVLFGTGSIAGGAPTPAPAKATLVAVLGPWVAVPPGQFRKAYA